MTRFGPPGPARKAVLGSALPAMFRQCHETIIIAQPKRTKAETDLTEDRPRPAPLAFTFQLKLQRMQRQLDIPDECDQRGDERQKAADKKQDDAEPRLDAR